VTFVRGRSPISSIRIRAAGKRSGSRRRRTVHLVSAAPEPTLLPATRPEKPFASNAPLVSTDSQNDTVVELVAREDLFVPALIRK
jgi:hypothetical protein